MTKAVGAAAVSHDEARIEQFRALRSEIDRRSDRQQALFALSLTATGAIGGAVFTSSAVMNLLLLLPALCVPLGFLWLDHAYVINQIGVFTRDHLWIWEPSWEKERDRLRTPAQVPVFMLSTVIVFVGPAAVGLAVYTQDLPRLLPIWLMDAALCASFCIAVLTLGLSGRLSGKSTAGSDARKRSVRVEA